MIKVVVHQFVLGDYIAYVDGIIDRLEVGLSPVRPSRLHVTFKEHPHMPLPNVIGTLTIDPSVPADNVTTRTATVALDALPALIVDLTSGTGTFPCLVGQNYSITDEDTNAFGNSLPSNILSGTVAVGTVPATPTGLKVSFHAAP